MADVGLDLTAQQAILALLSPSTGPFLQPLQPGQEYQVVLQKTGNVIPPHMTMDKAGVSTGDTLDIVLNAQAA